MPRSSGEHFPGRRLHARPRQRRRRRGARPRRLRATPMPSSTIRPPLPVAAPPDAFPNVRIAVRSGVGFDNLDLAGWGARGVPVCNVPDYGTTEVADHALALMLALTPRHRHL